MFYGGSFSDRKSVESNFRVKLDPSIEILVASYGEQSYEGDAFVLFRQDGKLYEVNGSHCSCYGLEDQWEPEEVVVDELVRRPRYIHGEDNEEIRREIMKAIY